MAVVACSNYVLAFKLRIYHFPSAKCFYSRDEGPIKSTDNFFYKIGSPKFISAPMVSQSSIAWRIMVRRYGIGLAYTQMLNANEFSRSVKCRDTYVDWVSRNEVINPDDTPLIAQFAGDKPDILVECAKYVENFVTAIDLNLGCPQKIAKRGNYGAFLLEDPKLVLELLSRMVKDIKCPITAKIRRLPSDKDTINLCKQIEKCGVQMITLHARTAKEYSTSTGPADWSIIGKVKAALSIPVIANGGIASKEDAIKCILETGADGVMSAEALLENPKMFSTSSKHHEDYVSTQILTAKELIQEFIKYDRQDGKFNNVNQLRSHLFKILHRLINASLNHDLRAKLAFCQSYSEIINICEELESRCLKYKITDSLHSQKMGLILATGWYARHRDAVVDASTPIE